MRASGILLPISSLPSEYGIGCFSKEAYHFIGQLVRAGQKYWQILPLGPTGYGDSPYQAFSTFAGNPYFIDLEVFIKEGLLYEHECRECDWGYNESYVDYGKQYGARNYLLRKAFSRFQPADDEEYAKFVERNEEWLEDYCMFMAIKNSLGGKGWWEWPAELRKREKEAMEEMKEKLAEELAFYRFQQYWFHKQWCWLKSYANNNGIKIIGDVPIYVAFDSADAWANPELFQFDEENLPEAVAGCPPDAFSATGQLWGNPLYRWPYHKKSGYQWWIQRIAHSKELYDVIRFDHFRGFDEYYAVPYGDATAENGQWEKGPGAELFQVLKEKIEDLEVIAEDLGLLTESVVEMLEETGFPGMKVLQFAFDSGMDNVYLPHKYDKNCVVYTGTHDNDTTKGWYARLPEWTKNFARRYTNCEGRNDDECVWGMIRTAMSSVADLAIIPMQDILCVGNEARMNMPSSFGDNWKWRVRKGQFNEEHVNRLRDLTELYGRF